MAERDFERLKKTEELISVFGYKNHDSEAVCSDAYAMLWLEPGYGSRPAVQKNTAWTGQSHPFPSFPAGNRRRI